MLHTPKVVGMIAPAACHETEAAFTAVSLNDSAHGEHAKT